MAAIRSDTTRRLAVLIDADNASAKIADGLFEEIAKIGEASVRRVYGDFSSPRSKGWVDILARHAIVPQQQFAYTIGKNASDITLVIDAMDLLHSGRFDGFCLVSSDSDFTRLAARIREQGVDVFGFGEQKTPESFRQACRRFIYTENLLPERSGTDAASATKVAEPLAGQEEATRLMLRVIAQMDTEDGWANLGTFGKQILNLAPDFDPRTYGFKKLSDLVRATEEFEVRERDGGGGIEIREAPKEPTKKPAARRGRSRTPRKAAEPKKPAEKTG
ncbi:NYN domain-containing protein [Jiella avicenniae]|uniref:NYN domain-containing protein n=1 Tax=Jiella avicenniae TaxID=2907202 RepID=A0A9X1NXV8_9HYPH|nr:NYN domain-containing protein [Jiella avicenniae]MCE7026386.1 NYN domain-containing protein [Jiella avicenniae]